MDVKDDVALFRAEKRITTMMKFGLDQLGEIYDLQQVTLDKLGESLCNMEEFIKDKHGVDIDLAHLAKHGEFLDEATLKIIRSRMFGVCENLRREMKL